MKRSDDEQLTDELIGEAALSLLKSHSAINTLALLAKLETMYLAEQNSQRRKLLERIIGEIEGNIALSTTEKTEKQMRSKAVETNQRNAKNVH